MAVYKRCKEHAGTKAENSCKHPWWGRFKADGQPQIRVNLEQWSGDALDTKTKADAVFERMKSQILKGTFRVRGERFGVTHKGHAKDITFADFTKDYIARHVERKTRGNSGARRAERIAAHFGTVLLASVTTNDIEDYLDELKAPEVFVRGQKGQRQRTVATVNRYIAMLRHMFNWAVRRDYLDTTPFRKGDHVLIRLEPENNKRTRRISPAEEDALLAASEPALAWLIVIAIETGLRRSELARLQWRDIDEAPEGWLTVRGTDDRGAKLSKSGKSRDVVLSDRGREAIESFRLDADGKRKAGRTLVVSGKTSEALGAWRTAFRLACQRIHKIDPTMGVNLKWHDLRHEYASRLVAQNVPLSFIRDLMGHASIVTTQRYDTTTKADILATVQAATAAPATKTRPGSTLVAHGAKRRLKAVK